MCTYSFAVFEAIITFFSLVYVLNLYSYNLTTLFVDSYEMFIYRYTLDV